MTDAHDLLVMLRRHYLPDNRPPGGIFAPEIASPDGNRRADLIWMPTTVAGRDNLVGHEIKVTRPDVLAELTDPTKADPWSQYCTHWWLVVSDPALIDGVDVPDAWGVMGPPSGRRTRSMTVLRQAPKLRPRNPAPAYRRVATWLMHRQQEVTHRLNAELRYANSEADRLRRELEHARVNGNGAANPRARQVTDILLAAERQIRDDQVWASVSDDDVVQVLVDLTAARGLHQTLCRSVESMVREVGLIAEPFKHHQRELERVLRKETP